jgi:protein-S-isoprenylcysteine O-methyltransferase Ste14
MPTPGHTALVPGLVFAGFLGYFLAEFIATHFRGARPEHRQGHDAGSLNVNVIVFTSGLFLAVASRKYVDSLVAPGPNVAWGLAGGVFCAAGMVVRGSAVWILGRAYSPMVAVQPGQAVVTRGPYRFVRHPAYTGVLLMFAGIGVSLGNLGSIVACVALPVAAILNRLRVEEPVLERELGEEYRQYARGKKRLVPGVW